MSSQPALITQPVQKCLSFCNSFFYFVHCGNQDCSVVFTTVHFFLFVCVDSVSEFSCLWSALDLPLTDSDFCW